MFKKLTIFWINHWVKIVTVTVILGLIVLTILGLGMLESFYRNLTLATIPLQLLLTGLNAFVFVYLYMAVFRGGFSAMKKSQVKSLNVNILFKDVIGLEEAKKESMEVVALLRDRAKVKKIGGKIIKGLLLVGPPGCGKTLLAKAIATEAGVPFLSVAGSEFVEIFVGVGASRVRKLFAKARQLAYANGACILFIDELDVIGRGRTFSFMGAGEETNSTQNQLLVEMDGLGAREESVLVIGATNAGEEVLDKALLRPGRFDRKIYIGNPNLEEREKIFRFYLSKVKYEPDIDIPRLARKSVYKSPADIESIIKEGALIAARKGKEAIGYKELTEAIERIELGVAHKLSMTPQEREMIAYHETGHMVTLYNLHPSNDVFKASIIARGSALGVVHSQPRDEFHTRNRDQILADIKVALAGFVAERIRFGVTSNGVASDFSKATAMAHDMVWRFGMGGDGMIGDFGILPEADVSNELKEKLNRSTQEILSQCANEVDNFLKQEWEIVKRFAGELLQKDELEYDEIDSIFAEYGKRHQNPPI